MTPTIAGGSRRRTSPTLALARVAIAIAATIAAIAGCTLLEPAAEQLGRQVKRYCIEPAATRAALESQVNEHASPNRITIDCATPAPAPAAPPLKATGA